MKARKIPKRYIPTKGSKDDGNCYACDGTGYYDSIGSPKCSSCKGAGGVVGSSSG
jgi:DnaJ-class molecular chaperone